VGGKSAPPGTGDVGVVGVAPDGATGGLELVTAGGCTNGVAVLLPLCVCAALAIGSETAAELKIATVTIDDRLFIWTPL
jgi:hypothetical protein